MSNTMLGIMRRMAAKLATLKEPPELKSPSEFRAACLAWRDRTRSERYTGNWRGPGRYELTGYLDDEGRSVAMVRYLRPCSQGVLAL